MPHRCHPLLSTTTSDRLVPYVTYAPHRQGGWAFRSECMFGLRSIRHQAAPHAPSRRQRAMRDAVCSDCYEEHSARLYRTRAHYMPIWEEQSTYVHQKEEKEVVRLRHAQTHAGYTIVHSTRNNANRKLASRHVFSSQD